MIPVVAPFPSLPAWTVVSPSQPTLIPPPNLGFPLSPLIGQFLWHCHLAASLKSLLFPEGQVLSPFNLVHNPVSNTHCDLPLAPSRKPITLIPVGFLFFVFWFFLVAHLGMWGLSSLTRDQTHTPCIVGRVLTTEPWGKSLSLFWMYIFRFCVHILCSSISLDWDPPPLYFHLEIPLVFQGPTQTLPPFWSFPWSFSEGLPSPSADLCFFLTQIPHFYSVACSCWLRTYSSLSSSPSRVEAPSLFIEWLIVSWSLGKTMKPSSRQ